MWKLLLTFSLLCWTSEGSVTCRNENNGEVDWYILYKTPKTNTLQGVEYLYIDSQGMRRGTKAINDPQGVLANTLKTLFQPDGSMPPSFGFISYGDQLPRDVASQNFGHSKGVLLVNESGTGIWLLHSTPKFPYARDENSFWPSTGVKNAQTFICVTFPYDEFRKIGKHLQYIRAFPFDHRIPGDFHTELQDVVNKVDVPPDDNFQQLTSSNRSNFYSIAKNYSSADDDGEDLYVNIAQKVSSDLLVQTWGCQMRRDTSFCKENKFKVENINTTATSLGQWNNTKDHSKWCVAKDPENNWMCVADVNRAPSQYARRGGALCINDKKIKDIFQNFANKIEDCQNRSLLDILNIMNPDYDP
ncbi:deoxyribonuclease-2-beta [Oreochromis niloticus]|uniref:deoxyribonuclease-2-beta n=1 Tax=Oreochromis niloticus TaxID=8128 RepID=UPI00022B2040|nr:deoxyribonuclease-2-beta [Oreochromis niloticus]XP_019216936.1 deoxyribonuclease-2-beta [Oreochromis niloticus]